MSCHFAEFAGYHFSKERKMGAGLFFWERQEENECQK
jgi:hypothetical protein